MRNYQKNMYVNSPLREVYEAITHQIPDWWTSDFTGNSANTGDHFTIAFGGTRKTFVLVEAIPDTQVVWECVKAYIDMDSLKNKAEWEGTRMIWTLSAVREGTTLTFLHDGLHPGLECYEVCEAGWDQFLPSLHAFLTTGEGMPFLKATDGEPQEEKKQVVG